MINNEQKWVSSQMIWIPKIFKRKRNIANKAESEERYSDAYQLYSEIIFSSKTSFSLPELKTLKSAKDLQDWLGESIAAYTKYILSKPSSSDEQYSFFKLKTIGEKLLSTENRIELGANGELQYEEYVDIFKQLYFPDQKSLPSIAKEYVSKAYETNLSIFSLEGDHVSHAECVLFNEKLNISISVFLEWNTISSAVVFLSPGEWASVCRVNLSLSDPRAKIYLEARGIRGRYAASFFTIPEKPHFIEAVFNLRELA